MYFMSACFNRDFANFDKFYFFTYPLGCNSTEYFINHRASSRNKNMYLQTKQHLLHSICIWDNPTCTYETQAIVAKVVDLRYRCISILFNIYSCFH